MFQKYFKKSSKIIEKSPKNQSKIVEKNHQKFLKKTIKK
jgi:hypothetical protein